MRMRNENKVYRRGIDGQLLVNENILTLLHAAVDDTLFVTDLDKCAAAGDLMCCT